MKLALFSSALLATGIASAAVPVDGWYTSIFGGYSHISSNFNTTNFGTFNTRVSYSNGYNLGGRIGFKHNPVRYEFEYTYVNANVNRFSLNNINQFGISGKATANLLMGNFYYDFPQILPDISPFIGAGIGYAFMEKTLSANGPIAFGSVSANRGAFAYQGTVGLTYNFSENYALNASYRYTGTTSNNGNRTNSNNFGRSLQIQMGNVGVIYRFDNGYYK